MKDGKTMTAPGPYGMAAMTLLEFGLAPLPLNVKVPAIKGFQHWDGCPQRSRVEGFCTKFGHLNVGVVTGQASGVTVIDLDGTDAVEVALSYGTPLVTSTPRGGAHAWFAFSGEPSANLRLRGLCADVKAAGGVVAVPPSVGQDGNAYGFLRGDWSDVKRLPSVPDHVRQLLGSKASSVAEVLHAQTLGSGVVIAEGQRNDTLFRQLLFAAQQAGSLGELEGRARELNRLLSPPLSDEEVAGVVESAWNYQVRGRNFAGRGRFAVTLESEFGCLSATPHALALLWYLRFHHAMDHTFAISPVGLAKVLGWHSRRVARARDRLMETGFVKRLHKGGSRPGDCSRFKLER